MVGDLADKVKKNYLKHLIAALLFALVLWHFTPNTYNQYQGMLGNFPTALVFILVAMVISYMILVIGSSDSLMKVLSESGYFNALNEKLTIASVLSLLGFLMSIIMIRYFAWLWTHPTFGWTDPLTSAEVFFFLSLFIISLALVFFVSVVLTLMKIAELRASA